MQKVLRKHREPLLAVLSGIMLTMAFPKMNLYWIAWFALIPLFFTIKGHGFKRRFWNGFITGMSHYITLLYWVTHSMRNYGNIPTSISILLLILLAAYLSVYLAVFSAVSAHAEKRKVIFIISATLMWPALEYARTYLLTGFPWGLLGYTQFRCLKIAQFADITGVYGISSLIVFTNCILYIILNALYPITQKKNMHFLKKQMIQLTPILIIFHVAIYVYGTYRINVTQSEVKNSQKYNIAIIQGNIDQLQKWDDAFKLKSINKYLKLSKSILPSHPEIIIWPETAIPTYFSRHNRLIRHIIQSVKDMHCTILSGCPSYLRVGKETRYYNSAFLINRDGKIKDKYDKVHLVPFGEYVPLRKWLPFVGKMVEQIGDFEPGIKGKTINWRDKKLGVQICFEMVFPELSREVVKNDANIIINITNDAWFGQTAGPYQHFAMTVFRAIENHVAVVRSANTGISGFILPTGKIAIKSSLFETRAISYEIPILNGQSFYLSYGDIFAKSCSAISIFISIIYIIKEIVYDRRNKTKLQGN